MSISALIHMQLTGLTVVKCTRTRIRRVTMTTEMEMEAKRKAKAKRRRKAKAKRKAKVKAKAKRKVKAKAKRKSRRNRVLKINRRGRAAGPAMPGGPSCSSDARHREHFGIPRQPRRSSEPGCTIGPKRA